MKGFGYVEIQRTCSGCGRPLPVNGPLAHVRCASCMTRNPVPLTMFGQVFSIIEDNSGEVRGGETRTQTPLGAGGTYGLTWGTHPPACRGCGTPVPEVQVDAGRFHCPGCGATLTTSSPPDWLSRLHPAVAQIYLADEEQVGEAPVAAQQLGVDQTRARPIHMACESCGGGLSITSEVPRIHVCEYCGASVGIPDELWERLHPVESVHGWYVRLEETTAAPDEGFRREVDRRYDEESLSLGRSGGRPPAGPSRWARLEIHTKCPSCKHPIPVNGPLPHVVCPACSTVKQLKPEIVGGYMAWVDESQPVFDGASFRSGGERFQVKSTRFAPSCARCGADLPLVEIGTDATIRCPRCSARYATFPVPEHVRAHSGTARQVYCGQREPDPAGRGEVPSSLEFGCPSCGADLTIDGGTGRVLRCAFCSGDVFLPDEVWTRLHPVERVPSLVRRHRGRAASTQPGGRHGAGERGGDGSTAGASGRPGKAGRPSRQGRWKGLREERAHPDLRRGRRDRRDRGHTLHAREVLSLAR